MGKQRCHVLVLGIVVSFATACVPMTGYYPQPAHYPAGTTYQPLAQPYLVNYHQGYSFNQPYYGQGTLGPEPPDAPVRRALLAQAYQNLGIRYVLGGETPYEGFDCSGLTQFVYKNGYGINLPRTAAEQERASRTLSFEQMRPGDLIFFRTGGRDINHVGIYIGRGEFIHAASGGGKVVTDSLSKTYWQQRLAKFGSFLA